MSSRQFNEVTCDVCGRRQTCDIGKVPCDMNGEVIVDSNTAYEGRKEEYTNVCISCTNKIKDFMKSLRRETD